MIIGGLVADSRMRSVLTQLGRRKNATLSSRAPNGAGYRVVSTADADNNDDDDDMFGAESSQTLERNLTLPTLIFLSVSNTIGTGIYVLTGIASSQYAGQYVCLSYLFAAIACFFSVFCYAEFAARVKSCAGSSYSFAYYSLGEFIAYCMGWMIFICNL